MERCHGIYLDILLETHNAKVSNVANLVTWSTSEVATFIESDKHKFLKSFHVSRNQSVCRFYFSVSFLICLVFFDMSFYMPRNY